MMPSISNAESLRSDTVRSTGPGVGVDRQVAAPRSAPSIRPSWFAAHFVGTAIGLSLGYLGFCLLCLLVVGSSGWTVGVEAGHPHTIDLRWSLAVAFPAAAIYFGLAWMVLGRSGRRSKRGEGSVMRRVGWEGLWRLGIPEALRQLQSMLGNSPGRRWLGLGAEAYRGQVQALSRRLVEVQEVERRQIARELHDEIGQSLALLRLNLQAALQSAGLQAGVQGVTDSLKVVDHVLEQVREMSVSVRPLMLDDLGLVPALRWYARRQLESAGMGVKWETDPMERRLDPVVESECFRIAQEALTNIVRHSRATEVRVRLFLRGGRLELTVADDGIGFDLARAREQAVEGASLGVLSMEERALMAGGGFEIRTRPGRGTVLRAWFPLRWASEAPGTRSP